MILNSKYKFFQTKLTPYSSDLKKLICFSFESYLAATTDLERSKFTLASLSLN